MNLLKWHIDTAQHAIKRALRIMLNEHEHKHGMETGWQHNNMHEQYWSTWKQKWKWHAVTAYDKFTILMAYRYCTTCDQTCLYCESGHVPRLPQPTQICYPSRPKRRLHVYVHNSDSITAASRQHHGSITAASRQHQGKTQLKIRMVVF